MIYYSRQKWFLGWRWHENESPQFAALFRRMLINALIRRSYMWRRSGQRNRSTLVVGEGFLWQLRNLDVKLTIAWTRAYLQMDWVLSDGNRIKECLVYITSITLVNPYHDTQVKRWLSNAIDTCSCVISCVFNLYVPIPRLRLEQLRGNFMTTKIKVF